MREDVVLQLGRRPIIELRFDLNIIDRMRFALMSLMWIVPIGLFIWYALYDMGYDLGNYGNLWHPMYAILFLALCVPPYWIFSPEHVKGAPLHLVPGWVLRLTKDGIDWRYHLFEPLQFYWGEVEMVALQRKGWSQSPYFVIYTKQRYHPTFALPHYRRELQRTVELFGDKAAAAISLSQLTVKEDYFRRSLEEMMRGSGFQIIREGRDVFYKKLEASGRPPLRNRPSFGGR